MHPLSPESEQAWKSLRRHLERSSGFTLVFVSSGYPPAVDEVRHRLALDLERRGRSIEILALAEDPERWSNELSIALEENESRSQLNSVVWLALDRAPLDTLSNQTRDSVLSSLNQQRTFLEREFRCPLVLVLPKEYLPRVWEVAPDLWTIRGLVAELSAPTYSGAQPRGLSSPQPRSLEDVGDLYEMPVVTEWLRLAARAQVEPRAVSPFIVHLAVRAAAGRNAWNDAQDWAKAEVVLARARMDVEPAHDQRRDLAIALEDMGLMASAQGDESTAENAFRECLDIRRWLWANDGESLGALSELASSLHYLVRLLLLSPRSRREVEDWSLEYVEIARRLVDRSARLPASLRELANALELRALLLLEEKDPLRASSNAAEGVALRRELMQLVSDSKQSVRELCLSLSHYGEAAERLGRLEEAETTYSECVSLSRRLMSESGADEEIAELLASSLWDLGRIKKQLGDGRSAGELWAEADEISWTTGDLLESLRGLKKLNDPDE